MPGRGLSDSLSLDKTAKVYIVPSDGIEAIWGEAGPTLARAVETGDGNYRLQDYFEALMAGTMQLWVAYSDDELQAAMVTQISNFPRKRLLSVMLLAGRSRSMWWPFYGHLEEWAKQQGCVGMEAFARKGLLKWLKDWRRVYTVIRKDFE